MTELEIKVQTFTHDALSDQLEQMIQWFNQYELKQDQVISITLNESNIHDSDSVLSVFYKSVSNDPTSTPLSNFKYKRYN